MDELNRMDELKLSCRAVVGDWIKVGAEGGLVHVEANNDFVTLAPLDVIRLRDWLTEWLTKL